MLTKEDLLNIKSLLDEQSQRQEQGLGRLEEHMDRLDEHVVRLDEHVVRLEEELAGFQRYTVQQLTVLENTMSIKFSALFDMHDMFGDILPPPMLRIEAGASRSSTPVCTVSTS